MKKYKSIIIVWIAVLSINLAALTPELFPVDPYGFRNLPLILELIILIYALPAVILEGMTGHTVYFPITIPFWILVGTVISYILYRKIKNKNIA
jgi:hypothetical protein